MQFWSDASTLFGGRAPQTSSISRSVETTSFGMQQKQREDAALLLAPDRQRAAVRQRLEWPEEPEFHGWANLTPPR